MRDSGVITGWHGCVPTPRASGSPLNPGLCPHLVSGVDLGAPVKQLFEDVQVASAAGPEQWGPVQLQREAPNSP